MIRIRKGLNIPLKGSPNSAAVNLSTTRSVGLLGDDYVGMKPTMLVSEGDAVKAGDILFEDKKNKGVVFTSPGSGVIESINRGARRSLQSIVINLDKEENFKEFNSYKSNELHDIDPSKIREQLINSGLWTSFRTRPFSKTPSIDSFPESLFINCMDTNPLSLNPNEVISIEKNTFHAGISILSRFLDSKIYLCTSKDFSSEDFKFPNVHHRTFEGPHPSGLSGTHMHHISPASLKNILWSINYSDVINLGYLFLNGRIPIHKYISLCGPQVESPRILKVRIGACTDELCAGQLKPSDNRIISGSVINGREAVGPFAYLGKFHTQVSVLEETSMADREFLNWMMPGLNKHSKLSLFAHSIFPKKLLDIKTLMNGADRSIVPIGIYEEVLPYNLLPTILLRYLVLKDTEKVQALGGLELDEEDLALCSYVCPSKYDFGSILRSNLSSIEAEG